MLYLIPRTKLFFSYEFHKVKKQRAGTLSVRYPHIHGKRLGGRQRARTGVSPLPTPQALTSHRTDSYVRGLRQEMSEKGKEVTIDWVGEGGGGR